MRPTENAKHTGLESSTAEATGSRDRARKPGAAPRADLGQAHASLLARPALISSKFIAGAEDLSARLTQQPKVEGLAPSGPGNRPLVETTRRPPEKPSHAETE
jgi:hypothetical protein